jgi:hypothetical protein
MPGRRAGIKTRQAFRPGRYTGQASRQRGRH